MKEWIKFLKETALFSGADEKEIEILLHCFEGRTCDYRKGQYVLRSGIEIQQIGIFLQGKGMIIQEDFWGSRNIVSAVFPGQCFGEVYACLPKQRLGVSVVAEKESRILFLNADRIFAPCSSGCLQHEKIIRNLLFSSMEKNLYLTEKLMHIGERTTRAKLLSYLSTEAERQGSAEIDLPFSRQELADYLFVDRSGLSAELSRLRDEGLIDFHRNHFVLKTPAEEILR